MFQRTLTQCSCKATMVFVSPAATHICGWLTRGRFLFFARAKKRNQKKRAPERATPPVRFSSHRALDQLAGRIQRASGSNTVSLNYSRWGCGTRRALRGPENTHRAVVFFPSRMACPSTDRLWASAPKGAKTGCLCLTYATGTSRMSAPGPKAAERRTARHPGVLSLGDFSLHEQREVTRGAGAEPPAIMLFNRARSARSIN